MPDRRPVSRALLLVAGVTAALLAQSGPAGAAPLVNTPPIGVLDVITAPENATSLLNVLANDTDADGDPLSIINVTAPLHGTAVPIGGNQVQYIPTLGFLGADTFTYTVSDGHGGTGLGVVDVTVAAPPVPTGVPGTYVGLRPARLLDTRINVGGATPGPASTLALQVAGRGGVPASGVAAVALNVTAVRPTGSGFLAVFAHGGTRPGASNLNFLPGQTVPSLVIAPVGSDGMVSLYNGSPGRTPLLADVSGYFLSGPALLPGTFTPITPTRLLDTRINKGAPTPAPHGVVSVQVGGVGGVLSLGVSAVVLNVTVVRPARAGFVTAHGDGATPLASNVNYLAGQTVSNLVVSPVTSDGRVLLYNGSLGRTPLVADVFGYFRSGPVVVPGGFTPLQPVRLLDTRISRGGTAPGNRGTVHLQVTGASTVPASGVSAVVMNTTVTRPTGSGFTTVFGDGQSRPNASNLNFLPNQTRPNLTIPPVGTNGKVALYNGSTGRTQLVGDVSGYFLADPLGVTSTFSDGTISLIPHCIAGVLASVGVSVHVVFPTAGSKQVFVPGGDLVTLLESVLTSNDGGVNSADLNLPAVAVTLGQTTLRIFARNGTGPTDPIVFDHAPTLPTC